MGIQNLTVTTNLYIDGDERSAKDGRIYILSYLGAIIQPKRGHRMRSLSCRATAKHTPPP